MTKRLCLLLMLAVALTVQAQTKVMTYNIRNSRAADGENNWENRRDSLVSLIKRVNPDVLGTQEVRYDQYKFLKQALGDYEIFGAGRDNGKHGGEHSALFFKKERYEKLNGGNFWLSETPNVPGSKSWDASLTRICTWVQLKEKKSGTTLFVFNTHFDHKGKQARRNSAALIRRLIDSLAGSSPVILTGDFNFHPDDAGYDSITTAGNYKIKFSDSYTAPAPNYTDCGFSVSNTKCSRIDYIFYSQAFTKSNYTLYTDNNGTSYPSDHLTISVVLSLKIE